MELEIFVSPTPNPNALKFVLSMPVKTEDNSTYRTPVECGDTLLAGKIFEIRGVVINDIIYVFTCY